MKRLSLALLALLFLSASASAQMKVHVINVGQAESVLLEFKTAAVLIDAGGEDTATDDDLGHLTDYLDRFFADHPGLREKTGEKRGIIYSLIVSHPHIDHTRHLVPVIERYKVLNLVDGGATSGSGFDQLRDARALIAQQKGIYNRIDDGEVGNQGYTTPWLRRLKNTPSRAELTFLAGARGCKNQNNDSLVLLVRQAGAKLLFVGDAESETDERCGDAEITRLLSRFGRSEKLDVDLYKVGHHGSHNGTTRALMQKMTPTVSVMSSGSKDVREPGGFHAFQFGHPRKVAVDMTEEFTRGTRPAKSVYSMGGANGSNGGIINRTMRKAVFCTCWDGDIVVTVNSNGRLSAQGTQ